MNSNLQPNNNAPVNTAPANSFFSEANKQAALAGAGGGFLGYILGEIVGLGADDAGALATIFRVGIWAGVIGMCIGAAILAYDNWRSLRGQWNRDLSSALPLFFGLSFISGSLAQVFYFLAQTTLTRGIAWSLAGIGIGAGIGILRRDRVQAQRGAIGGAAGGFIGGFLFNALTLISSAGNGAFSRCVGLMILGAAIALLMRVVQDAMKNAWLLGVSTGPYEGREYPLNTANVSVGRSEASNIALFRERGLPEQLGAFVFNDGWNWQGAPVLVNGQMQSATPLRAGDTIQFGDTQFRFQARSVKAPRTDAAPMNTASQPFIPPVMPVSAPTDKAVPPVARRENVALPQTSASPQTNWQLVRADGSALRLPMPPAGVELGRAETANIVLAEESVSSRHARFDVRADSLSVCDLGSTNGTLVNGARLVPQVVTPLKAGDTVAFGLEVFTVRR